MDLNTQALRSQTTQESWKENYTQASSSINITANNILKYSILTVIQLTKD